MITTQSVNKPRRQMSQEKIDKILEILKEKLSKEEVPDSATGKITINLQSGGVSGNVKLELSL
jgi:hypothetical protein